MYSLIHNIAEEFGIRPQSINKCKYYYVLNCSDGIYSFSQARPKFNKIVEIHNVKSSLEAFGINSVDSYLLNSKGLPYAQRDGRLYTITKFFGNNELDFSNDNQVALTLKGIGNIHKGIDDLERAMFSVASEDKNIVIDKYIKELKALERIKKSMNKAAWSMDITKVFESFYDRALYSVERLRELDYGNKTTYCHNRLKEGNIIYKKGKIYIIDWDNMKRLHYLEDISFFVKRYIRKNCYYAGQNGQAYMSLNEALNKYLSSNMLSLHEREVLKAVLWYPHRFVDTMIECGKIRKTFLPTGVKRKLDECILQKEFEQRYLGGL